MDYLTFSGIALGSLLIAIYLVISYRSGMKMQLSDGVIIFLSCSGFTAGVKVALFAFDSGLNALVQTSGIDVTHIFLGGLAICWVSVVSVLQIFRNSDLS